MKVHDSTGALAEIKHFKTSLYFELRLRNIAVFRYQPFVIILWIFVSLSYLCTCVSTKMDKFERRKRLVILRIFSFTVSCVDNVD